MTLAPRAFGIPQTTRCVIYDLRGVPRRGRLVATARARGANHHVEQKEKHRFSFRRELNIPSVGEIPNCFKRGKEWKIKKKTHRQDERIL